MRQTTTPIQLSTSPDQITMFDEPAVAPPPNATPRAHTSTAPESDVLTPCGGESQTSAITALSAVLHNIPCTAASPSTHTPSAAYEIDLDPSQIRVSVSVGALAHGTITDEAADAALTEDLRRRGQLAPVTVRPLGDRTFELIDGHRRVRAHDAVMRGADPSAACRATIRAVVRQVTPLDAAVARLAELDHQRDLCALERAVAVGHVYTLARADRPALTTREFAASVNRAHGATSEQIRITEHITARAAGCRGSRAP